MTNSLGLPKDYEIPKSGGNYMKFAQGDNKFRILSQAIIGWEYWNTDNKPVRLQEKPEVYPCADTRIDSNGKTSELKHFWAFIVWNYQDEKIQLLEITQKGIMGSLKDYAMDEDMGDIQSYDIKVTRTGEGLKTEYGVRPLPAKELDPEIKQAYEESDIKLEALFAGDDPFKSMEVKEIPDGGEADDGEVNPDDVPF